ncbi:MAG: type 4a pilus biogenesis protein PilO [Candidatus Riflebacteria bacterium]|nr:type 4a pilus biogenesis protein PilO [Candidatus Riflebacteria bacterium]
MAEEFSISEWLKKAKGDPKVAAQPLIIVAALFFGGYKGLYAPKAVELLKEDKKVKSVEANIKKVQSAVDNIEDIKLDIEDKKSKLNQAIKRCYRKSEMTSFLRRVRELATQAGIPIKSVNPQPLTQEALGAITVEKFPVTFSFSGDLVQLGTFLRLIEKEEKITFVKMPNLKPNASGTFDLDITPIAVLIADEMAVQQ